MSKKRRKPKWAVSYRVLDRRQDDKKFPLTRCKECRMRYWGVERDVKTNKVLREFSCKTRCEYYRLSKGVTT